MKNVFSCASVGLLAAGAALAQGTPEPAIPDCAHPAYHEVLISQDVRGPARIVVGADETLYVQDFDPGDLSERIVKLATRVKEPRHVLPVLVADNIGRLTALALDPSGRLYLALPDGLRRTAGKGIFSGSLERVGGPGSPIAAMRFDAEGHLYTLDPTAPAVHYQSRPGPASGAGGVTLPLEGQPVALALDRDGNLFVSDVRRGLVEKLDAHGNVSVLAQHLVEPGELDADPRGNVFVTDGSDAPVKRIGRHGEVCAVVRGVREFLGVAVAPSGHVFVTESRSDANHPTGQIVGFLPEVQ